jgi:inosine-uridine nucleoside N-ribohydrolase
MEKHMKKSIKFPQLPNDQMTRILQAPVAKVKPLRVVIDTDFGNEIDDYFALSWLLLQSKQRITQLNRVNVEAITVAPFSFKTRLDTLVGAYTIYLKPSCERTPAEQNTLDKNLGQIEAVLALGKTPYELRKDPHLNGGDDLGVEDSYQSVLKLLKDFNSMGLSPKTSVFKGSTHFMHNAYTPVDSEGARQIVKLASTASLEDPLYVIAIGCPTNVASALLMQPDIVRKIVVIWDAGYPTNIHNRANNSLNLDEDLFASQLLFSSGVPLVYIPGFYIAQQLNLSEPDVEAWFKGSGIVGQSLYERYIQNPLFTFYGIDPNNLYGRSWVIWDIANVAWLLNPNSVPSSMVEAPILSDAKTWLKNPDGHRMREADEISVNSIFPVFAKQLRCLSQE